VIVGGELVTLEELDGRLVELEHDDLVEEAETLDVLLTRLNLVGQLCNLGDLAVFAQEERAQSALSILHFLELSDVRITLGLLADASLFHFILCLDCLQDCLQVKNLKLKPATHDSERVLHLLRLLLDFFVQLGAFVGPKHQAAVFN